ncbi:unnamed protein product [Parnassius mnemosyne]|uniref:Uncharacterized protein n=1 Tax=Parnassius mnemosyne TaxID=213953 RepID=A0AAV1M3S5_9NEOP
MADEMAPASGGTSNVAENEMAVSELGEAKPSLGALGYPPYPPYATDTAPPSVAETIIAGRDLRRQYKFSPQMPARPPPKPAKPRGPKATDVKMTKRASKAHSRCMRRHGAMLTDRLEYMAKPRRRNIIYLWREHANILPPETIARLRSMLDADEPFKPDQAYEYFVNLRKTKKKRNKKGIHQIKKDMMAICDDKRFLWARNATVAFARGIQQRLSKPGHYTLADGMLRLSDLILHDICRYMRLKTPTRNSTNPKSRFMLEMSDKIAIWIDEIISESDDRMLMMDFDEDEDVVADDAGDAGFADDFLNMMQGVTQPAYKKFTGDILEAFTILTNAMYKKGEQTLTEYGKFRQTYAQAADTLKQTPDFAITEINSSLAQRINQELSDTVRPFTTTNLAPSMKDVVDMCSNYLAQHATFNKDKGTAFKLLVTTMRKQPNQLLYEKGKFKANYGAAAAELSQARSLESDHDDSDLTQEIHSKLSKLVDSATSPELKSDMAETLDVCSKYLSQSAVDKSERGPAFDILIKALDDNGEKPFTTQFPVVGTNYAAAHVLSTAPGLTSVKPNEETVPVFEEALHKAVDLVTPESQKKEMDDVIKRSANYLSGFTRDRGKAFKLLLQTMKKSPTKELAKRNNYTMSYGSAAEETESAPFLAPFLPVKDIADEINEKLTKEMEGSTPSELKVPMKSLIQDVSKHLSQPVALKSGAAGEKYPMDLLVNVKKSIGKRPLYKYKGFGQTYADAAESLKHSGEKEMNNKNENLETEISTELKRTLPSKLTPDIAKELDETVGEASRQLANIGTKKGDALEHLTHLMKEKDEVPLANIQGYEQTYGDAARRISNATSLVNEKVDKPTYAKVKGKLKTLAEQNPLPENTNELSEIVDECSEFLASSLPEDEMEKRRLLADLMARKDQSLLAQNGVFKLTYNDAGQEIIKSPVNVEKTLDEGLKTEISQKINATVPDKKLQDSLKDTINGAASYLANLVKGRGEAVQLIHDGMKKEKDKNFISIGKFNKTHEQAAEMLEKATTFSSQQPSPAIVDKVSDRVRAIPIENVSAQGKPHVEDAVNTISKYIAGVATEECGLDAKALASLNTAAISDKIGNETAGKSTSAKANKLVMEDGKVTTVKTDSLENQATKFTPNVGQRDGLIGDEATGKSTSVKVNKLVKEDSKMTTVKSDSLENQAKKSTPNVGQRDGKSTSAKENKLLKEDSKMTTVKSDSLENQAKKSTPNVGQIDEVDPEREQALQILHSKLKARGAETFYKQPHNVLTHAQASEWLSKKPFSVDKSVKESADTARLHKKFERKLSALVGTSTAPSMQDAMQDVIIETSRNLSEYFMSKSYNVLAREAVISEMQNRGNEILVEVDGAAESFFYSAQRLKKAKTLEAEKPCSIQYNIVKKLEEMVRSRGTLRKLTPHIKDYIHSAGEYLSEHVTKPDKEIEAYVALLAEMEAAGDSPLVEGNIRKSHKEAAAYLRQLTSFDDQLKLDDNTLRKTIETKLGNLMANVTKTGYSKSDLDHVIHQNAVLLTSYIKLQGEKTDALKVLIEQMDKEGENVLLRHGNLRKTYLDGANILRTKNADQLHVVNADPVVSRKIQIKLNNLMLKVTPNKYKDLMDEVVHDVTNYLAVHFLQPEVIKVCKCMKNVFVQCELWCEEILRRMNRPCCTCSRHVHTQQLADVCPDRKLYLSESGSHLFASGLQISLTDCPSKLSTFGEPSQPCPASKPTFDCHSNTTASYVLYTTQGPFDNIPTKLSEADSLRAQIIQDTQIASPSLNPRLPLRHAFSDHVRTLQAHESTQMSTSVISESSEVEPSHKFWQSPTTMFAKVNLQTSNLTKKIDNDLRSGFSKRSYQPKNVFSSRTPIITTDQMFDWHSMMVSLIWNVQAWRVWIQENINKVLAYHHNTELAESWTDFQRTVSTEILQWHQYSIFSVQLTIRLASKYNNKKIISPTRTSVKTKAFLECHNEMLEIIDMFSKWTQWLTVIIKETDLLLGQNLFSQRWQILKEKVKEQIKDWDNYNQHLIYYWENRFKTLISDWIPGQQGAVWVMSACGAVPSGAVAAGICDGEVIWVARTTHKCKILPAALYPSKHCCVLYTGGRIKHYTKYQVLCNARVQWVAFRAGTVPARAVRVGDVCVGRVRLRASHLLGPVRPPRHRCHVAMFGRPFAFDCYELLVMDDDET